MGQATKGKRASLLVLIDVVIHVFITKSFISNSGFVFILSLVSCGRRPFLFDELVRMLKKVIV